MNDRHKKIIEFAKKNKYFTNKDLVKFFNEKVSRPTITRDLIFLVNEKRLLKKGTGSKTEYFLAPQYKIIEKIDVNKYFSKYFLNRDVLINFNFDIFNILENDIFTNEEIEKITKLQNEFLSNFSKYGSQTIINKEFERIMIEFS